MPDPLLRFRPEFPILEKTTYLIPNALGAMPRAAAAALAEYAETWASRGVRAWSGSWWEMSATVGDDIAPLIGAPAGSVSLLPHARRGGTAAVDFENARVARELNEQDVVVDYRPASESVWLRTSTRRTPSPKVALTRSTKPETPDLGRAGRVGRPS